MRVLKGMPALMALGCLVGLSFIAAACGDDDPTVEIITPEDGQELDAGDVQVAVEVKNFDVVDKLDEEAEDGEGHVHYYIDAEEVPTEQGEPAVTEEGTYHAEATKTLTWEDVDPGEHTFAVQLVNNDHTPLDPPVVEEVTVTVGDGDGDGAPSPTRGASPTGGAAPSPTRGAATPSPSPEEEETQTPSRSPSPSP